MNKLKKIFKGILLLLFGIVLMSFIVLRTWRINENEYPQKKDSPYKFPVKRQSKSLCIQGNNTLSTHKEGIYKYSYDILLPMETEIYASRDGIVNETLKKVGSIGFFKGNFVSILHNDGTVAIYAHLKKNSIVVNVGDTIKTGQLIGYSGCNGMAIYPHLHMHILKNEQSIPFVFSDFQNESGMPEFLHSY
jgi:murein DD-endopeptidase MepM/ murein hydrolase activator NlpD